MRRCDESRHRAAKVYRPVANPGVDRKGARPTAIDAPGKVLVAQVMERPTLTLQRTIANRRAGELFNPEPSATARRARHAFGWTRVRSVGRDCRAAARQIRRLRSGNRDLLWVRYRRRTTATRGVARLRVNQRGFAPQPNSNRKENQPRITQMDADNDEQSAFFSLSALIRVIRG
jgi:hypothetical protein